MKTNVTCISCPLGCQMVVEEKDGKYTVTGNTCKNGEKYWDSLCFAGNNSFIV